MNLPNDRLPHAPVNDPTTELTAAHEPTPYENDATATDESLPDVPGFRVVREIARGGMGVVYAAHDPAFEREVAIKVMNAGLDAGRFVVESKVTAQLPHPGVPPVHVIGTLADGRPFLAMKLIAGQTLADELGAADRAAELPRFLGIFERICQTVGFAHARGIVHRDLKPANVMVSGTGEVLVMDWGLAKSAREGAVPPTEGSARTTDESTLAGQVKGTPAYMAPEQARGEPVDARADVFALGGVLAVILTGRPPFVGKTALDTVKKAAAAELNETIAQLDGCGADAPLVAIAKRCLSAGPADRFADGKAVADAIGAYRVGVEEQARRVERERAATEARAGERRKKRRVQMLLAVALLLLACGGAAFAWWQDRKTTESRLADERAIAEQDFQARQAREGVRTNQKLAEDLRKQYKFKAADAALVQALKLTESAPELLPEVERARADLAFVAKLDDIRYRKWAFTTEEGGKGVFNTKIAAPEYRAAFAERGLDLTTLDPAAAAERISASAIKAELVAAVDDWALWELDAKVRDRLLSTARKADPGAWTDRLRDPAVWTDRAALAKVAATADPGSAPPATLVVLAALMERGRLDPAPLLSVARTKHPTDFELAFFLGLWHGNTGGRGQQIVPYEAARALRPDNYSVWINLGAALMEVGDVDGAIAMCRGAIELSPRSAPAHINLGAALAKKGDVEGAIAAFKEGIRLGPQYALAHYNLGNTLRRKGDVEGAIAAYKEAIRTDPQHVAAHDSLGQTLGDKGDVEGAIAAHREAVRLDPKSPTAHTNLGTALAEKGDVDGAIAAHREAIRLNSKYFAAHYNLGHALRRKGDTEGAIAAFKEAIKLNPKYAPAHASLGLMQSDQGDVEAAIATYREAIRLDPQYVTASYNLGNTLYGKGDVEGAIVALREAIKLNPKHASAHNTLGLALAKKGDVEGAIAAYKEAIRLDVKSAAANTNLGNTLARKGDVDGAIAAHREAVRIEPKSAAAHHNLGTALVNKGDVEGAIAAHREAVRLDPRDADTHTSLGIALANKGDADGATVAFRTALKLDPRSAPAETGLGAVYLQQKNYTEAIACARRAISADPKLSNAHVLLGQALQQTGDISGARAAFTDAARLDKRWESELATLPPLSVAPAPHLMTNAVAINRFGRALSDKKDFDGAIVIFNQAIGADPAFAPAHFNLGFALSQKGDTSGAAAEYKVALRLNPKHAHAYNNLGGIYHQQKKYAEAADCARAAISADPKLSNAHALLGLALRDSGDVSGARDAFGTATRLDKRWESYLAKLPPLPLAPMPHEVKIDLSDDLRWLQGTWQAVVKDANGKEVTRFTKVIAGNTERVTFARSDGTVSQIVTFDIKLEMRGAERVYAYSNGKVTEGANKGQSLGDGFYPYTLLTDTWVERKPGRALVWQRAPDGKAPGRPDGVQVAPPPRAVGR